MDKLIDVLSRADALKLSAALYNLVDSVKGCSQEDLQELYKAGRLPEDCLKFVLSTRKV